MALTLSPSVPLARQTELIMSVAGLRIGGETTLRLQHKLSMASKVGNVDFGPDQEKRVAA